MEALESSRQAIDESSETLFRSHRRRCFCFPCFDRSQSSSGVTWWQSQMTRTAAIAATGNSLWARGVGAVMKIREWSELVAGPRWKTFIRRFNRNRSGGNNKQVNFQYDPLSYAMNFDEGQGHSGDLAEEGGDGYYSGSRNFSSRYAKGSMDFVKNGPTFV